MIQVNNQSSLEPDLKDQHLVLQNQRLALQNQALYNKNGDVPAINSDDESFAEELGEDPNADYIEQDDGSVIIPNQQDQNQAQQFDENLAEHLDSGFLQDLATELLDQIENDKTARSKRDKQYEDGLRRTGLGDDAPGGAGFSGASKVVHPVLAESCIDFASRAIKELFPAGGPVKVQSDDLIDPQQERQVKQLSRCLNNQFTTRIAEYRTETEKLLTQLPLGGSQFMKLYWSSTKNRICAEFVSIDNIFIPFYATSFYDSERVTHRQYPDKYKYDQAVKSGTYRDLNSISVSLDPDKSVTQVANDKIEGKESIGYNDDGVRIIYEVYTWLEIDKDEFSKGERVPYIVTIDEYEQDILSIRRNWDQNDTTYQKLDWLVEDVFIYWMGAYGIGLPHLIGGLSAASTGALRALLDSAHINNAPTLLKLKGSRLTGQTKQVDVTNIVEIEGPTGVDDIRKYLMTMPFNAPSPVLFQLLGWLTDAAKGVVSTASEKIADATANTPVGTVQALIEQGAVIFSSIHSRLHFSQAKKFEIVVRLLKTYGQQDLQEYGLDPSTVSMQGIKPVSDPRIFSEAQRFAQMQGVLQLASSDPGINYNKLELHRSMLQLMKVNNIDRLLPVPQPPQPCDPAQELISWLSNKPVVVTQQQDHSSHIMIHVNFLRDPLLGKNPIMVPITMKVLDHLKEHLAMFFATRMLQVIPQQQPMQQPMPYNPQVESSMAQISMQIVDQDTKMSDQIIGIIAEATAFVKDNMDWLNPDPTVMATRMMTDAQKAETDRKLQVDALNHQREMQKLQSDQNNYHQEVMSRVLENQTQAKADMERIAIQRENDFRKAMVDLWKERESNATQLQIEAAKLAQQHLSTIVPEQPKPDLHEPLTAIMQGLKATIEATHAPRKTTALRNENGDMIGARSELDMGI